MKITLADLMQHQTAASVLTREFRRQLSNLEEKYKIFEHVTTDPSEERYWTVEDSSHSSARPSIFQGGKFPSEELAKEFIIADICIKNDMIKFLTHYSYIITKRYHV